MARLSPFPKRPYTTTEYQLFELLPKRGKRISSHDMAAARAKLGNWDVAFPANVVTVTMNRLIEKIEVNGEPFRIAKEGKSAGHHIVEYWIERKKNGK